jgi:hypothetical protein
MTQIDTVDAPAAPLAAAPTAVPTPAHASRDAAGEDAIHPFRVHVSDADLADLR